MAQNQGLLAHRERREKSSRKLCISSQTEPRRDKHFLREVDESSREFLEVVSGRGAGVIAMTSLAETIDTALAAVGPETEDLLRDVVAEFEALPLAEEERLAVLATSIAAIAHRHHRRHVSVYLEAVRTWSLEIAEVVKPAPTELRYIPRPAAIEQAARHFFDGLDSVIDRMQIQGIDVRDRLVTELAVMARFLGRHDANTISIAIIAVNRALADLNYQRGAAVQVPMREVTAAPVSAEELAAMPPRGTA